MLGGYVRGTYVEIGGGTIGPNVRESSVISQIANKTRRPPPIMTLEKSKDANRYLRARNIQRLLKTRLERSGLNCGNELACVRIRMVRKRTVDPTARQQESKRGVGDDESEPLRCVSSYKAEHVVD
jgi:hypothetical protein